MIDYNIKLAELQKEAKNNGYLLSIIHTRKTISTDGFPVSEQIIPKLIFVRDDTKPVVKPAPESSTASEVAPVATKSEKMDIDVLKE